MTKTNIKNLMLISVIMILFASCTESFKDTYYDRPEWLEPPIYTVLEERGNFTNYLQCVNRTQYSSILKGAGLYTVFAPNDQAFTAWMQEKSYQSVNDIPDDVVKDIVSYSIVYSKWTFDKLAYRFVDNKYELGAFKRKTACYSLPYQDDSYNSNWVFDETVRNGISYTVNDYLLNLTLQNYKYLPVYTNEYFNSFSTPLSAFDYNVFYPNSIFNGQNVQTGQIVNTDILCENGIVHEVSTVNEPQKNIEILLKQSKYSVFNDILNFKNSLGNYIFRTYTESGEINTKLPETFQTMLPGKNISQSYVKKYSADLGFSPVMENIFSETNTNETEKSGKTLFVPNNDVLDNFIHTKILKYYQKLEDVPIYVLTTLINTHMVKGLVWPTLFQEAVNCSGDFVNGEGINGKKYTDSGILGAEMASNGMIYQTDHVIKSRYFETVYSEIYLNPDHTLLNTAYTDNLREELMKSPLTGYNSERWTILNFSDKLLAKDGFSFDDLNNEFVHTSTAVSVDTRLQRLINMHIFSGIKNSVLDAEITDFSSSPLGTSNYNGWGYIVNNYGDMIRYKNNQLQAAGNIEDNSFVTVSKQEGDYNNGQVFNVDKLLEYSPRETGVDDAKFKDLTLWDYLDRARTENPNVSDFVNYVEICLKKLDSKELDGIKTEYFYTVLMPNNSAMTNAKNNGYLPTIDKITSDNANFDLNELAKATKFVNSHFLVGKVFADDGLENIYPVNPLSPSEAVIPTILKITNEKLELVNKATQVKVYKYKSGSTWILRFEPQDVYRGNQLLIDGTIGTGSVSYISGVNRGKVNATATDNFRSNRIACKAVLHEVNNFLRFSEME